MTPNHTVYHKLVVISRAGWIRDEKGARFQDNDGRYLDSIAKLFKKVVIIGREFSDQETHVNYQYIFRSQNITLFNGMGAIKWRELLTMWQSFWRTISEVATSDVVYCFVNTARGSAYLLLARLVFRKPVLAYSGIDREALLGHENRPHLERTVLITLERAAMRLASARIVTGPKLYNMYRAVTPTVMAAPVSLLLTIKAPQRTGHKLGDSAPCRLLCVSHLHARKNIDLILRSCKILLDRNVPIQLQIVGDGTRRQELETLATTLGLNHHVHFHGYIAEPERLARFYVENDIFIFASTVEGFPRAVWEAVHFGLYVVCVKVGGVETIFSDTDMTILPQAEPELIAQAVANVERDPIAAGRAAASARYKMAQLFTQSPAEQFESCLADAMSKR
jgi:glycosyltransferase involved in cell wall biosynthesis